MVAGSSQWFLVSSFLRTHLLNSYAIGPTVLTPHPGLCDTRIVTLIEIVTVAMISTSVWETVCAMEGVLDSWISQNPAIRHSLTSHVDLS